MSSPLFLILVASAAVAGFGAGFIGLGGGLLLFEANMVRVYRQLWLS